MTDSLLKAFFERDLSEAEELALAERVLHDVAAADRLAGMAAGLYAATGLPQPGAGPGLLGRLLGRLRLTPFTTVLATAAIASAAAGLGFGLGWTTQQQALTPPVVRHPQPPAGPQAVADVKAGAPRAAQVGESLAVVFELKSRRQVVVEVLDRKGRRVAMLAAGWFGPGTVKIPWDGTDRQGRALPPGPYRVIIDHGSGTLERKIFIQGGTR